MAYTFDAGPNAFLLALEEDMPLVLALLVHAFGDVRNEETTDRTERDLVESKQIRLDDNGGRSLKMRGIMYTPANLDDAKHQVSQL